MTGRDEDIEGGSENFSTPERGALKKLGGAPKICILQNQWERGAPKKLNRQRGELLKFQASSFNIFISPPCHIKCTFPYILFFLWGGRGKGSKSAFIFIPF